MRIHTFVLMFILLIAFVEETIGQTEDIAQMDSCDFRMDTTYAGHLYRKARRLIELDQFKSALVKLDEAKGIYLNLYDRSNIVMGIINNEKSKAYWNIGDLDNALYHARNALRIGLNNTKPKPQLVHAYDNLGVIFELLSQSDSSKYYLEQALSTQNVLDGELHSLKYYSILGNLALSEETLGNISVAAKYYREILRYLKKNPGIDDQLYLNTCQNFGSLLRHDNQDREAINVYSDAIKHATDQNISNKKLIGLYVNKANAYNELGDSKNYIELFKQALELVESYKIESPRTKMAVYFGAAGAFLSSGDFGAAELYYLKLIDQYNDHSLLQYLVHMNLGILFSKKGEYDQSIKYLTAAEEKLSLVNKPGSYRYSDLYLNIGETLRRLGSYERAQEYLLKALNILLRNDRGSATCAMVYNNLGITLKATGDYDLALSYLNKSIDISTNLGFRDPKPYTNIGNIYKFKGALLKADTFYKKSLSIMNYDVEKPRDFSLYFASSIKLVLEGLCKLEHARLVTPDSIKAKARLLNYHNCIITIEEELVNSYLSEETKSVYLSRSVFAFERAISDNLRFRKNYESLVFSLMEKVKVRELRTIWNQQAGSDQFGVPTNIQKQEHDLSTDIMYYEKKKYLEEKKQKSVNDSIIVALDSMIFVLKLKMEDMLNMLKYDYPTYYKARYDNRVIAIEECKTALVSRKAALVEYFVGDSSIFTFTILPDTFYVHQIKKDFPLDTWVKDMLHGIYDPYTPGVDTLDREFSFQQAASLIYHKVFHHVDTLLPEGTDIILVPDGILGYIPFDALLTDSTDSESYLIRDHQISYAYSATLQTEMEKMEHDHQAQKKILAFAPSFDLNDVTGDTNILASRFIDVSDSRNWLGPLKYNDDEVHSISQMVPTDVFMDSTATKDQFLENASDYSIIHLSTHGKANDKMGDYSFLAFYDPQDSSETWLYNRELYGLDLNADMVVLSACETGIGELQRGEGIISLARGFSYAGAKSIITTLWSVNDRSTQKVMELFYSNLAEGMPKDEALRQAKLDYLDEYPHLGKSPYFWAGIIPIGDMSPISFQNPWYQNPWYLLGGLFLLGLGIWGSRKLF